MVSCYDIIFKMNTKHRRTLNALFENPIRANINWQDVESMLKATGAVVEEGQGSRILLLLNGVAAVFHRPHPRKEIDKGAIKSLRRFLLEAGVKP
jgi:hypothetical protein